MAGARGPTNGRWTPPHHDPDAAMRVAIVHHWWLSQRGGEAVVMALAQMYPDADLHLHVCDEALVRTALGPGYRGRIVQTFIGRLPGARRHYQKYLPLMPLACEQLDLSPYDLVLSIESGPAKGVVTRPDALHICYCNSPMRYVWDMYHEYRNRRGWLVRTLFPWVAHYLRLWDRASADRVDHFVANSAFVAARIRKFYRRDAHVVHPPVNVQDFSANQPRGRHYLVLGQLVPYKRVELAVRAFNELGLPLVVIGEGEEAAALKAIAHPNIRLLGRQPFDVVREQLQTCRALVFPGVEDFGIVPVEAMAAGAPVIAFARGGALETVVDGVTGCLFHEQTVEALKAAVERIESGALTIDPGVARQHAQEFTVARFKQEMQAHIEAALQAEALTGANVAAPRLSAVHRAEAPVVLRHADVDELAAKPHPLGRKRAAS
jgi:glycosyltransferase involved in cell wall biosynthesis